MHLEKGDTVGIASPSSSIVNFPRRLRRGIIALEGLGLKVVLGKNIVSSFGHNAGTVTERAKDINDLFADESVKAIICSTGGYNANAVLPLIDFDLIRRNPKIFCGFSDITVLNLAINLQAKLITFNGPTVLPTLGEFGGPFKFTIDYFKKALFKPEPIGKLVYPTEFTDEVLWWETEDNRKRKLKTAPSPRVVYDGTAEGTLWGGNLDTLSLLIGTNYVKCPDNCILFLEEEGESTASIERKLTHLDQLGVFKKINGLIFGRPYHLTTNEKDRNLYDILLYFAAKYGFPVIADVDCGHTNPMFTFPIGVKVSLSTKNGPEIIFLESATI